MYILAALKSNMQDHSQFMTKIQVGHGDMSWSKLGRLRIDQDFTR